MLCIIVNTSGDTGAETDHAPGEEVNRVLHIRLTIADLDAEVARLEMAGIRFASPVWGGPDGNRGPGFTIPTATGSS